MFMLS